MQEFKADKMTLREFLKSMKRNGYTSFKFYEKTGKARYLRK